MLLFASITIETSQFRITADNDFILAYRKGCKHPLLVKADEHPCFVRSLIPAVAACRPHDNLSAMRLYMDVKRVLTAHVREVPAATTVSRPVSNADYTVSVAMVPVAPVPVAPTPRFKLGLPARVAEKHLGDQPRSSSVYRNGKPLTERDFATERGKLQRHTWMRHNADGKQVFGNGWEVKH